MVQNKMKYDDRENNYRIKNRLTQKKTFC